MFDSTTVPRIPGTTLPGTTTLCGATAMAPAAAGSLQEDDRG